MNTSMISHSEASWVVGILQGLITTQKFAVLIKVTHTGAVMGRRLVTHSLSVVFRQLFIDQLYKGAFTVLEYLLLGYQHSPDVFHSLVNYFPPLLDSLAHQKQCVDFSLEEPDRKRAKPDGHSFVHAGTLKLLYSSERMLSFKYVQDVEDLYTKIIELVQTLMYIHMGFPELYTRLLKYTTVSSFSSIVLTGSATIK